MVYRQDECQATPYQEKAIKKKWSNKIRQNQGKSLYGQWLLELLEVPIELEQA